MRGTTKRGGDRRGIANKEGGWYDRHIALQGSSEVDSPGGRTRAERHAKTGKLPGSLGICRESNDSNPRFQYTVHLQRPQPQPQPSISMTDHSATPTIDFPLPGEPDKVGSSHDFQYPRYGPRSLSRSWVTNNGAHTVVHLSIFSTMILFLTFSLSLGRLL